MNKKVGLSLRTLAVLGVLGGNYAAPINATEDEEASCYICRFGECWLTTLDNPDGRPDCYENENGCWTLGYCNWITDK